MQIMQYLITKVVTLLLFKDYKVILGLNVKMCLHSAIKSDEPGRLLWKPNSISMQFQ